MRRCDIVFLLVSFQAWLLFLSCLEYRIPGIDLGNRDDMEKRRMELMEDWHLDNGGYTGIRDHDGMHGKDKAFFSIGKS